MQLTVLLSEIFRRIYDWLELFPFPTHKDDVFAIRCISIAFPMKQFSFKFILRVIVQDSDTNIVHTFYNNNNMHGALDVVIIIMISITKIEVQHVVSNGF